MANLIRCKSCGYVTEEGKVKDVCPACGVPAKMFEPYIDPVSPKRRMLLKMDIHPIIVHFTVAFTFSLLVLNIAALFTSGKLWYSISVTAMVMSHFLPLTVVLSMLAGLLDGKIRFRKVTTPLLRTKIALSCILLVLTSVYLVLMLKFGFAGLDMLMLIMAGILAVSLGIVIFLALIGTSLLEAKFPG